MMYCANVKFLRARPPCPGSQTALLAAFGLHNFQQKLWKKACPQERAASCKWDVLEASYRSVYVRDWACDHQVLDVCDEVVRFGV